MDSNKIHYRPGPALGHVFIRNLYAMNISLCFPSFIFKCTFDLIFLLKALRKSNRNARACVGGGGGGAEMQRKYTITMNILGPFVTSPQPRLTVDLGQNAVPCLGDGVCLGGTSGGCLGNCTVP